eukprot:364937-Chlamydomonas_euryale.AAC.2
MAEQPNPPSPIYASARSFFLLTLFWLYCHAPPRRTARVVRGRCQPDKRACAHVCERRMRPLFA